MKKDKETIQAKAYITARVVLGFAADHPTSRLLASDYLPPQDEAVAFLKAWMAGRDGPISGPIADAHTFVTESCWLVMADLSRELAISVIPGSAFLGQGEP